MRICIIGPASNVHVHRWSTAMLERGHSVSLLSTSPLPAAFPAPLTNVPVYEVPTARPGMDRRERFTRLIGGWARVPSLLATLNLDIVHVHSLPAPAATPFLMRVPRLVVSAWGSDVVWRHPRKERLYPWLLAHATRVTATSEYLANVVASYLRAHRTIEVIAFGVDGSIFYPAPMRSSVSRIGTLRHLEPKYGIDTLVRSLPAILAAHPSAFMDIAGEGEQRHHLEQMIDTLGVARRVHLRGRIEHALAPALFAKPGPIRESLTRGGVRCCCCRSTGQWASGCGLPRRRVARSRIGWRNRNSGAARRSGCARGSAERPACRA